jgi:type IV pilus assembly protein PilW
VNTRKNRRSAGFSLVEIMVGMTIGLITVLVVAQVMQIAETRKRSATSGSDSVVNATLGLYTIERDAKNAGFGISSVPASIGCEVRATYNTTVIPAISMAPMQITDGAAGAPDSLRILSGSKNGITLPTRIAVDHAQGADTFFVESDLGIQDGDMIIAVPATLNTSNPAITWCTIFQMAGPVAGPNQIPHASGTSLWNHTGAANILPAGGYVVGDYLANLGTFVDRTYSINSGSLTVRENLWSNNTFSDQELYPNVVQLQAVYGKDTSVPADGIVDAWNATAPTSAAEWQQIRAVRIALVARSQDRESSAVTLDGNAPGSLCNSATPHPAAVCWRPDPAGNGVTINVSAGNLDWQRYRYRVMESTIPLRNAIWQQ